MSSLRWFVSADGVPDKNCYRRYRIRTVEGQDDFASMAEVVRRRYSRVLLEAREVNPDAAEFSQENQSAERRMRECRTPSRTAELDRIRDSAFARSDHRGWRQGAALFRLS